MPDGTTRDPRWGDYEGTGIWRACPDCGALHEIEEPVEFRALLETLCTTLGESSNALYREFGVLDPTGRWYVTPAEGLFSFVTGDGRRSVAPYGVIASWNAENHSWMWAWGFPDGWAEDAALRVVRQVHEAGRREGWEAVTSRLLCVNEHEAWHLTKLAAHVADMPMVYRARVNETNHQYFAIGRPRWVS